MRSSGELAMIKIILMATAVLVLSISVSAQTMDMTHMDHDKMDRGSVSTVDTTIVQDWARKSLADSPRHQEWVKVKYKPAGADKEREVSAFVVYPEVKKKALSVVVIHEIFGMSDWVQKLTDEVAEAGYIGIAPDLLYGMAKNGGGTTDVAAQGPNAVGMAIRDLPPDQITADLNAVADYVAKLPAANGKVAVGGFCWGGSQTFRYATNNPKLKAAFVFYGSAPTKAGQTTPDSDALGKIGAPVYGFYAGNDARIGATVPPTTEAMKALKKPFDPVTYDGAGHGFMRAGEAPSPAADADQKVKDAYAANKKARDAAWVRWKSVLAKL
jgi:carboxymethylenebutenolidase